MKRALLLLAALSLTLDAVEPNANAAPAVRRETRRLGASYYIGGYWFQYLGQDVNQDGVWLYPHQDGVPELFQAPAAGGEWRGSLDSRFTLATGRFRNLFNAAELLQELSAPDRSAAARQRAARILRFFIARHPDPLGPYYLRRSMNAIEGLLGAPDRVWLNQQAAEDQAFLDRVARPGIELPALAAPRPLKDGPAEFYRRWIADGYLDIAVIGGNLYDPQRGTLNAWKYIEEFKLELVKQGFELSSFRDSKSKDLLLGSARILGQPVRVRIWATGASLHESQTVRCVANFVSGLAHADLLFYHGHSNHDSGAYFLSETPAEFARFQLGLGDSRDLENKAYGLGRKPYQLFGLQSCLSYSKYAVTLREALQLRHGAPRDGVGVMANPAFACMYDFVPRYAKLVELILKQSGARTIQESLNAIRPDPITPNLVLRNVLQARDTFLVPPEVTLAEAEELPADAQGQALVRARGSDGATYYSSEVFAQDRWGEVRQIVPCALGLYALFDDGAVYEYGQGSQGSMRRSRFARATEARFQALAMTYNSGRERFILLGKDGIIYEHDTASDALRRSLRQAPPGVEFRSIGAEPDGRWIAQDADMRWHAWAQKTNRFEVLEAPPDLSACSPALGSFGRHAEIRIAPKPQR
ncbi:MAG: hypothetical protein HS116_15415 [Planctomycetes bacterium]|nr:hypothetical protein [Planctomycetota bacterium]